MDPALPKTTPRAKATTNPSNTEGQPQELPTCSPQLTSELLHCLSTLPDPWPLAKITINWTQQAEWVSKNGKTFATTCVHVEVLLIFCFLSGKDRALERDRPYWRETKIDVLSGFLSAPECLSFACGCMMFPSFLSALQKDQHFLRHLHQIAAAGHNWIPGPPIQRTDFVCIRC